MIGSITKTFTAVLIMALRDEGRLALDDRLDTYLPGTRHGAVTIRQMLAHASGLQREPVGRIWENLEAPDQERLLRELEDAERVLPPHFAFHYSNLAYALLGQIVERLEKRSWEETVTERILAPLEMRHTGLAPDEDAGPWATSCTRTPAPSRPSRGSTCAPRLPLGGLWSTVADLGALRQLRGRPGGRVVSPDTVEEMCRPLIMTDVDGWGRAYGLGFGMASASGTGSGRARRRDAGLPRRPAGPPAPDGVGAVVFSQRPSGAQTLALATAPREAVLDAEPALARRGRPAAAARPRRAARPWWSEGSPSTFFSPRRPAVVAAARRRPTRRDAVAARGTPTASGPSQGRERGELLEVVRGDDGSVRQFYFATYAVTRTPQAFADLSADAEDAQAQA